MKQGIHPKYYQAKVTCNCGNTFTTGSTKPEIHVETCSKCSPAFTGKDTKVARTGRAEEFKKKYNLN